MKKIIAIMMSFVYMVTIAFAGNVSVNAAGDFVKSWTAEVSGDHFVFTVKANDKESWGYNPKFNQYPLVVDTGNESYTLTITWDGTEIKGKNYSDIKGASIKRDDEDYGQKVTVKIPLSYFEEPAGLTVKYNDEDKTIKVKSEVEATEAPATEAPKTEAEATEAEPTKDSGETTEAEATEAEAKEAETTESDKQDVAETEISDYKGIVIDGDFSDWDTIAKTDFVGTSTGTNNVIESAIVFDGDLYIYYSRDKFSLTFYTNNTANAVDIINGVPYEKALNEYSSHGEGQKNGYYFVGWFADPSCTELFDFSQKMPHNHVAVYGKWLKQRFRIVIDPNADNVYMGSQATSFRIDYDERIDGGLMESATRAGYILDGWYTDPDFTNRFLFTNPVNTGTSDVDMTYQTAAKWAAARAAYGDDDEARQNVRGILHLYAKWIPDPSARGINIEYDPGDAALYDGLGNTLTTVPVDTHMYGFDGSTAVREAPTNYNELYTFKYWEVTKEDGTVLELHPGDPLSLAGLTYTNPVYDEVTGELIRETVKLRAVYDLTGDPSRITHITYDGNTFEDNVYGGGTQMLQGETRDGTQRLRVTLDEEVNQTIVLPTGEDFYLDGWELVGWSFTKGTYEQQVAGDAELHPNFTPGQEVAADNLVRDSINDTANTLYAMWRPKKYTVTVRQVVEDGVPVRTFTYPYKTGPEDTVASATEVPETLTGNTSFTVNDLNYYGRTGDVIRITTPTIPDSASYSVRVNAVVTKDDGTTEILNPTALGDYQILGDVTITYTYSPKVLVKLQKRDATNHNTVLTGAQFVLTPVEYNATTQHWENAGSGSTLTVDATTLEQYLQEGTYRIVEVTAPGGYALVGTDLYLTVEKDAAFTLFAENGSAIDASVAELNNTGDTLTVYDEPVHTVTVSKTVDDGGTASFSFTATVLNSDDTRLANYVVGHVDDTDLTTNSIGQVTFLLANGENIQLKLPHGSKLTVSEAASVLYNAEYKWNDEDTVEDRPFGSEPVAITANGTLAYTNRRALQKLRIHKVGDDAADGLAGAKFSLAASGTVAGFTDATGLVSMDGTAAAANLGYLPSGVAAEPTVFSLPVGTYTLTETEAPEYYDGLTGGVALRVDATGITATAAEGDEGLVSLGEPDAHGVYTLTVTNTRKLADVMVVKNAVGTEADQDAEYRFATTGLGDDATSFTLHGREKSEVVEGVATVTQENTKVFADVPYGTVFSVAETACDDFDTTIVVAVDGEEDGPITNVATGNITVTGNVVITYTNTRKSQPVSVWKTDMDHNALTGASFSLYKAEDFNDAAGAPDAGATAVKSGSAGSNGILSLDDVATGEYRLVETQAPAGYNRAGSAIKITVTPQSVSAFQDGSAAEVARDDEDNEYHEHWVSGQDAGTWQVRVWNNPGVELPAAGDVGTLPLTMAGVALILAGAVHLAWYNRFRASNLGAAHR